MSHKASFLLIFSFVLLSGCTKSCKEDTVPPDSAESSDNYERTLSTETPASLSAIAALQEDAVEQ